MLTVRLHVDGKGIIWFLARCKACRNIHKYRAIDVSEGPVSCKSCRTDMHFKGALVEGGDSDAAAPDSTM
jgi:hypothetical protein